MPLPLGPLEIALALTLVAGAAAIQSGLGFGLALIAAPVLLLIHEPLVPGPLIASGLVLTGLVAHRDRVSIDVSGLSWAMGGRVVGTVLAALFLHVATARVFDISFAGLTLLGVALSASGLHVRPRPSTSALAGSLSGLMGTISSIGGPPMALLYQREGSARLRGTLAAFFFAGSFLSLLALHQVGRFGPEEWQLSLLLAPGMALGFLLSAPLLRHLDRTHVRPWVLGLSMLSALAVLARALL